MLKEIKTLNEFKQEMSNGHVLIDFYATWCGPCKMMHPVLENLNKKFSDVKFLLVNVDKFQEIAGHYGVSSIPSIFFLKEGNIIKNVLGYHPERELEVEILELFK